VATILVCCALERGVEVTTYTDYRRRVTGIDVLQNADATRGKCGPWIGSPGLHSSSSSV
jgi:hypothetical protein